MKKDNFANRLKIAMERKGYKQIDLVEKTNISKSLVNKYLAGVAEAKQDKLTILSAALDTNEVWLMGYDVDFKPYSQKVSINNTEVELKEVISKATNDLKLKSIIVKVSKLDNKDIEKLDKLLDLLFF